MKQRIQGIILGFIISAMFFATITAVFAASARNIEVSHGVNIVIDGIRLDFPDDMQPFIYSNRTFVSVRGIADVLGLDVDWDGNTSTVYLNTPIPRLDLGGIEITIGNRWGNWCTDTAAPQTPEEEARLLDRIYVQQRYNFRIREINLFDFVANETEMRMFMNLMIAAGDTTDIIQLEPAFFMELNEIGVFTPLSDDIFIYIDGMNWHHPTIDSTRIDGVAFGWARDVPKQNDAVADITAIFWHSWLDANDVMIAYQLWNRPISCFAIFGLYLNCRFERGFP